MTGTIAQARWETPGGHPAVMAYREGTSDWNTISSVMGTNDEYSIPGGALEGFAADIGAHVGAVSVALALDNPDVHVFAVEPVPQNCDLLRFNVQQNDLLDRVTVLEGAIGGGFEPVRVWYGYRGTETMEHHAWIGNSSLAYDHGGEVEHDEVTYQEPITIAQLLAKSQNRLSWVKIDCEGGEWTALATSANKHLPYIIGEYHPVRGHTRSDLIALLEPTHTLSFPPGPPDVDPEVGPGLFVAVRR